MTKAEKLPMLWQWRVLEYIAYGLVFLMPLYFNTGHWAPFGAPKTLLIIGGVFFMLIFLAWGWVVNSNTLRFRVTWLHLAIVIYLFALTISGITGVDPLNSFFGTYNQPSSIILISALGVFAFLVGFLAEIKDRFLDNVVTVSFVSSTIVALIAYAGESLIPLASGGGSTLGNNAYAGAYLLLNFCFGIALFFKAKKYRQKTLIGLGLFIIILCPIFFNIDIIRGSVSFLDALHKPMLFLGQAMGAILGLFVAITISLSLWMFRAKNSVIKISGVVLFVVFMISIFFTGYQLVTPGSKVHEVYVAEKTASRFVFWDIANSGFVERPFLGWGFGNYANIYQKYFHPEMMGANYTREAWITEPHNILWEDLSTTGIVGTTAFLLIFGFLLYIFFRRSVNEEGNKNIFYVFFFGGLMGYFVQNLFIFDTSSTYLLFFLMLGIGLSDAPVSFSFGLNNQLAKKFLAFIMIAFSFTSFFFFVVQPWQESKEWKQLATSDLQKIPEALQGVQDMSKMGNIRDTTHLYDQLFNLIQQSAEKAKAEDRGPFLPAIEALVKNLEKEMNDNPEDFRAHFVAGKLLNLHSVLEGKINPTIRAEADMHFETARKINPYNPLIYLAIAQSRYIEHDLDGAKMFTRASIALTPLRAQSYIFAETLMKISPDKSFENYIKNMKDRWISN